MKNKTTDISKKAPGEGINKLAACRAVERHQRNQQNNKEKALNGNLVTKICSTP